MQQYTELNPIIRLSLLNWSTAPDPILQHNPPLSLSLIDRVILIQPISQNIRYQALKVKQRWLLRKGGKIIFLEREKKKRELISETGKVSLFSDTISQQPNSKSICS